MKSGWFRMLSLVLVFLMSTPSLPAQAAKPKSKSKAKTKESPTAVVEQPVSTWPAAELTIGVQARDSETEGIGDLLVPVWNPGGNGLLFVNPRTAFTDHDAEEANLGVGYRQLLPKQNIILGANAYYDYRDTGYSHYDQWGFGLELLSPWIDARANYYDPESTKTLVASETQTSVSQSSRTDAGWNDPYADDHAVLQDYVVTRTVTTVTTTKTFEQYEQALGGYDWEIGLRLPLQCKALEARVFGGYYDFDRDYGDDAKGWKARAEIRLRSSLFLDAGLYENADLTGSDWFAGARLSIPLDLAKISQGRNPFGTAKARLRGESRDFSARLTEMVMRDPQIRLETSKFIENPALATETVDKDKDKNSTTYVLLSDVQFVDGDATGLGNGTGQNPYATIQQGADAVFGSRIVYVYDASRPYVETVQLLPGTTLWGSSILIPGYDGKVFGSGIQPVVDGASMGPAITVANRTTVQGFYIRNTDTGGGPIMADLPVAGLTDVSRVGILGNGATDLMITRNTLADGGTGALFARQGDFDLLFSDNLVHGNAFNGVDIQAAGNSGSFNATITHSLFSGNGGLGLSSFSDNYDVNTLGVDDCAFFDNAAGGLNSLQVNSGIAIANLSDSSADGNAGFGINIVQAESGAVVANLSGSSASGNAGFGLNVVQVNSDTVTANLSGFSANGNAGFGINLVQADAGIAVADLSGFTASGNGGFGLNVVQANSVLAMAMVEGGRANDNGNGGMSLQQTDNLIGLANVSGSTANDNGLNGITLNQDSLLFSVGLIGIADGLDSSVNALAGMVGLSLPDEVAMFLRPDGPVTASGNGASGVEALTQANLLALGGYFDIAANDNGFDGVSATVNALGIGIGLAGSSENWADVFELANGVGDLLGVDLALSIAGTGHFQANDNANMGFMLNTYGGLAGIDVAVGLETLDNGTMGTLVNTLSDSIGISALARVESTGNGHTGLMDITMGDDAAIGIIADVNASDNGAEGINATVFSPDGFAALLTLSTDALRPAAALLGDAFLGAPFEIPGSSFGPVVANGNGGMGFMANVTGYDGPLGIGALAVFLDTQTDGNNIDGLNLTVNAIDGFSISAILSSDLIYDVLSDVIGFPPVGAPLGPVTASGNTGNGIVLDQSGLDGAFSLLAGIEADNNLGGDGINANLTSTAGDVFAVLIETDAANNGDDGIELDLGAFGAAISALTYVDVDNNANQGVNVDQTSLSDDAFALLGGVDAMNNGAAGIVYHVTADASDAAICVTESESMWNGGRGANFILTAAQDAVLLVGTNALPSFIAAYPGGMVATILGLVGDLIPQDEPEFSHNGAGGMHAEVTSTAGDVLVDIDGAFADDNVNAGFNITANALAGDLRVGIQQVGASDNGGNGINLDLSGGGGAIGLASWLSHVRTSGNGANGINVVENYNGTVNIGGERIVSTGNTANGVRIVASGLGGVPVLDFGGGLWGSTGQSSIYGNGNRDLRYNNGGGGGVAAQNNWWGVAPPAAGQFAGNIDYSSWQLTDPNAP